MEDFVAALCKYFSNRENLIIVSSHAIGNYVVQTLLNNYGRDPRTEPLLQVRLAEQLLRENLEAISQNEYGYKMVNNLHGLLDLKDFSHGRRNGPGGRNGARGRGGFAGGRKDAFEQRQARPHDFGYAHPGYPGMGQLPLHMFFGPHAHPPLPAQPFYGLPQAPSPHAYPPYPAYNYQAPEDPPAPKRLRGGTPRSPSASEVTFRPLTLYTYC